MRYVIHRVVGWLSIIAIIVLGAIAIEVGGITHYATERHQDHGH